MQLVGSPVRILALSLVCAPMLLRAAQPGFGSDLWKLVLPEAKWILGVDWARARNFAAAQILARQFQGAESRLEASGLGLQAITSVERIIASGASLEMQDQEGPQGLLVAIEGAIDRAKLKKSLPPGTAVERFHGADLFVPPKAKSGEPLVALAGSRWMLVGDRPSLAVILTGRGGPADTSLYGRAARMAMEGEIWLAASAAAVAQDAAAAAGPLAGLRELDLLVSLQRGLRMQASLAGESPDLARSLGALLQSAPPAGGRAASEWVRRLDLAVKGNQLHLALDIPAAELERALVQAKASALALGRQAAGLALSGQAGLRTTAARGPSPETPPGTPPPPSTRAVRIVGLEDGPREIPYMAPRSRPH